MAAHCDQCDACRIWASIETHAIVASRPATTPAWANGDLGASRAATHPAAIANAAPYKMLNAANPSPGQTPGGRFAT